MKSLLFGLLLIIGYALFQKIPSGKKAEIRQFFGASTGIGTQPTEDEVPTADTIISAKLLRSRVDPFNPSELTCEIDGSNNLNCEGLTTPAKISPKSFTGGLKASHFGFPQKIRLNPEGTQVVDVEIDKSFGITFLTQDKRAFFVGHRTYHIKDPKNPANSFILRAFQKAQPHFEGQRILRIKHEQAMTETGDLLSYRWAYTRASGNNCLWNDKLNIFRFGRPDRTWHSGCEPTDYKVFPQFGPFKDWSDNDGASCVVSMNGELRCWGQGSIGQLGVENMVSVQFTPQKVNLDSPVRVVATTAEQTCAVTTRNQTFCWGLAPQEESQVPRVKSPTSEKLFYMRPVRIARLDGFSFVRAETDDLNTICLQTETPQLRVLCRGQITPKYNSPAFVEIRVPRNAVHLLLGRTQLELRKYCFVLSDQTTQCVDGLQRVN